MQQPGGETWNGATDFKSGCRVPLASMLATALCKIHAVLCWKIVDVHGIEVYDVQLWKFAYFRNIFQFLVHNNITFLCMVVFYSVALCLDFWFRG